MARKASSKSAESNSSEPIGFEANLLLAVNITWVQHFISDLGPHTAMSEAKDKVACFVFANGSMSSNQSGGKGNRLAHIETDLVDCMVDGAF